MTTRTKILHCLQVAAWTAMVGCRATQPAPPRAEPAAPVAATEVGIQGDGFTINGRPTYEGRTHAGMKIEGLLMNSRMVQGIFDDLNLETRGRWAYPDSGKWDPERNLREFLAAMPLWRQHGLLSFTINLQGGSPEGYSKNQPWQNSAVRADGSLDAAFMDRLARILDEANKLGMVAIVGYYYFGQDQLVTDETAVKRGVVNATNWLLERGYRNVLVEIANEISVERYDHAILTPARVPELIELARATQLQGRRLLVGVSWGGGDIPGDAVVAVSDFILLHGNGVKDPAIITDMVAKTRALPSYRPMPIVFNEDDHFDFEQPSNNMLKAIEAHASWGYFDPGKSDYESGYQCPPVNWGINTDLKRSFFTRLQEITGAGR